MEFSRRDLRARFEIGFSLAHVKPDRLRANLVSRVGRASFSMTVGRAGPGLLVAHLTGQIGAIRSRFSGRVDTSVAEQPR
jgi:hypothetical protein